MNINSCHSSKTFPLFTIYEPEECTESTLIYSGIEPTPVYYQQLLPNNLAIPPPESLDELIEDITDNGNSKVSFQINNVFRQLELDGLFRQLKSLSGISAIRIANDDTELNKLLFKADSEFEKCIFYLNYLSLLDPIGALSANRRLILSVVQALLFMQSVKPKAWIPLNVKIICTKETVCTLKLSKENVSYYLLVKKEPLEIVTKGISALKNLSSSDQFIKTFEALGINPLEIIQDKDSTISDLKSVMYLSTTKYRSLTSSCDQVIVNREKEPQPRAILENSSSQLQISKHNHTPTPISFVTRHVAIITTSSSTYYFSQFINKCQCLSRLGVQSKELKNILKVVALNARDATFFDPSLEKKIVYIYLKSLIKNILSIASHKNSFVFVENLLQLLLNRTENAEMHADLESIIIDVANLYIRFGYIDRLLPLYNKFNEIHANLKIKFLNFLNKEINDLIKFIEESDVYDGKEYSRLGNLYLPFCAKVSAQLSRNLVKAMQKISPNAKTSLELIERAEGLGLYSKEIAIKQIRPMIQSIIDDFESERNPIMSYYIKLLEKLFDLSMTNKKHKEEFIDCCVTLFRYSARRFVLTPDVDKNYQNTMLTFLFYMNSRILEDEKEFKFANDFMLAFGELLQEILRVLPVKIALFNTVMTIHNSETSKTPLINTYKKVVSKKDTMLHLLKKYNWGEIDIPTTTDYFKKSKVNIDWIKPNLDVFTEAHFQDLDNHIKLVLDSCCSFLETYSGLGHGIYKDIVIFAKDFIVLFKSRLSPASFERCKDLLLKGFLKAKKLPQNLDFKKEELGENQLDKRKFRNK